MPMKFLKLEQSTSKSEDQADSPSVSAALLMPRHTQAQGSTLGCLRSPTVKVLYSYVQGKHQN